MCGIIGITKTKKTNNLIGSQIYEALTRLEYRGYDSVGMAVISKDGIELAKDKGSINEVGEKLNFNEYEGSTAIGHSRWATHGAVEKRNAHPHKSNDGRVVVVHNGIIENFMQLKKELQIKGVIFESDTDTEIIPNLIEMYLKEGMSMVKAIISLIDKIEGTYALVISSSEEPDKIYVIRKDNPLVIGITEDAMFCASDIPAFLPWTREVIILKDLEIAILEPGNLEIISAVNEQLIVRKSHEVTWDAEAAQKGGYPHFMIKEIHEQEKVLRVQLKTQNENIELAANMIQKANKVILVAAGSAYYASLNAYYNFINLANKVVIPCVAAEWSSIENIVDENSIIISVSQSGETLDTIKAIKSAKTKGAKIIAVVNVVGSTLTQISDLNLYIHSGPEIGVAATKTFSSQSLMIWRIGFELAKINGSLTDTELKKFENNLKDIPKKISEIIKRNEAKIRDISNYMYEQKSAFYLGRDISLISAYEGALKIKEIAYIHAEGYPAGESKHGPIALIEDGFPVVFTIPKDYTRDKMMGSVQEMAARGALTIGIIEEGDDEMIEVLDHYIEIPKGYSKFVSSIAYNIPLQLLAYYTSVKRGLNPDRPRNLAKSVTVE